MANGFANRPPRLDTDAVAQWLDEIGMPIVLAGAVTLTGTVMTMLVTTAG